MAVRYHHRQPGYVILGVLSGILLLTTIDVLTTPGPPAGAVILVAGGIALVGWLFGSLTVEVTDQEVRFHFGPGFWRRAVPLEHIVASRAVRNSPLVGWGIRYTPDGWVYNVSGLGAVEITRMDGRRLFVGSDEPERLCAAIESLRVTRHE